MLMTTLAVAAVVAILAFGVILAALLVKGTVRVSLTVWKLLQFTMTADEPAVKDPL